MVDDDFFRVYIAHDRSGAEVLNVVRTAFLIEIDVPVEQHRCAVIDVADIFVGILDCMIPGIAADVGTAVFHASFGEDQLFVGETTGEKIALVCSFTDRQKAILKAGSLLAYTGSRL